MENIDKYQKKTKDVVQICLGNSPHWNPFINFYIPRDH